MKIANLLEQNRKHASAPGALGDCLGDGFLLANNSIYRRIRSAVLKDGFRFSTSQNDAYRALPLSQLDWILETKVIPYIDNVTVLEGIEKKIPKQTGWNDISDNLKGNSVFHEACHGVARGFCAGLVAALGSEAGLGGGAAGARAGVVEARVLVLLIEESFANTCELLSILDAGDAIHRIFIELNSYIYMLDDRVHLANAQKEIGREQLTKFILLTYLHANFLRELSDRDFDRVVALALAPAMGERLGGEESRSAGRHGAALSVATRTSLRRLAKIAFKLNPRFREVTTRFFLRLGGIGIEMSALAKFDFLKVLETSASARQVLDAAAKMIG